jgi:hypothetical protein
VLISRDIEQTRILSEQEGSVNRGSFENPYY